MVSADYDVDRAQFFKKEAFQAFQLMDDRTPDYYISYNPFKNGHDDKELDLFGSFFARHFTDVCENILIQHDGDDEDINDLEHRLHVSLIFYT